MSEPVTAAATGAVGLSIGAVAVELFGVPTSALIGAAFGGVIALSLAPPYENKQAAIAAYVSSWAVGVYGGQWLTPYVPAIPIAVLCATMAAIGVGIVPVLRARAASILSGNKGGEK